MPTFMLDPISGRYLPFQEREEIALFKAQGTGVREIARPVGALPSTISRELRRNAATRGGKLDYRASVAQWKSELVARRRLIRTQRSICRTPAPLPAQLGPPLHVQHNPSTGLDDNDQARL